jgi:hypothetical protein
MSISLKNDAGTFSTNLIQSNPTANVDIALPTTSGTMALKDSYASTDGTTGGTVKMKIVGSTLYIRNDGTNA